MKDEIIPPERTVRSIRYVRDHKGLPDSDLAALYGVTTGNVSKAASRDRVRSPSDFMFRLTAEAEDLISQNGRSKGRGGRRHRPYAFTEQGVAMLSGALNSARAVKVNIAIMRAFVKLCELVDTNRELAQKFSEPERHVGKHDQEIATIFEAIQQLIALPEKPRREIGFHVREKAPLYRARARA